ncbi:MAG TPA: alpha/beta hydrolase [Prosthecobacter sp.]|nr:alpha/beta hydrolase [Prosthecobacter sp.]
MPEHPSPAVRVPHVKQRALWIQLFVRSAAALPLVALLLLTTGCASAPREGQPEPDEDEGMLEPIGEGPPSIRGAIVNFFKPQPLGDPEVVAESVFAAEPLESVRTSRRVKVYFGTLRRPTNPPDKKPWFTGAVNPKPDPMTYGSCWVSIPKSHKVNQVEKASVLEEYLLGIDPDDASRFVVLYQPRIMSRDVFGASVGGEIRRRQAGDKTLLVFIHGYNSTFDSAASRLAVLAYDMNYNGVPVLFSWPSVGNPLRYLKDGDQIKTAYDEFPAFLEQLSKVAREAGAERVNILAHSMGNRVLVEGMKRLAAQGRTGVVNEIVMAAPDVAREELEKGDTWNSIRRVADRVTLYTSNNDLALDASEFLDRPRLGQVPNPPGHPYVAEGMDTVDVAETDFKFLSLNHTYFGAEKLIDDVRDVLEMRLAPDSWQRRLKTRAWVGPLPVWTFAGW